MLHRIQTTVAKSLGIWLDYQDKRNVSNKKDFLELHLNYWRVHEESYNLDYLDIGIKFLIESKNASIKIYFPFRLTDENLFKRLGKKVLDNGDVIEAVFNTNFKLQKSEGILELCQGDEVTEKLDFFSTFTTEKEELSDGAILSINVSELYNKHHKNPSSQDPSISGQLSEFINTSVASQSASNVSDDSQFSEGKESSPESSPRYGYLRFRVILDDESIKCLSQEYKPKDRLIISAFEQTEIIDFRLNEVRDLPDEVYVHIGKNFSKIRKVHFFIIREVNCDLKLSHADFKRCRILEKGVWNSYLQTDTPLNIESQMLIYHWTESAMGKKNDDSKQGDCYLEKFSAFAKFSKRVVSRRTIIISVLLLGLFGALAGMFGDLLEWLGEKAFKAASPNILSGIHAFGQFLVDISS